MSDTDTDVPDAVPDPFEECWMGVQNYLGSLDPYERPAARRRLMARLKHPELGGNPQVNLATAHPQGGSGASTWDGPMCVCGAPRRAHNIDGERRDCDGFVEMK